MDAVFAELVILPLLFSPRKDAHFRCHFLLRLISHPVPGAFLRGRLIWGLPRRTLALCILQPLSDGRLFLRCGPAHLSLDFLQFLTVAAVVGDLVDHPIVVLQGHFRRAQRGLQLHRNRYDLPADTGEQLRLLKLLGVLLNHVRGQECETVQTQVYDIATPYSLI